ncbi:MAG: hypothetical protein Q8941_15170 [Bacteroidota bacterium]|nr:hypothetical protein [Bacteroidota bacterium]
MLLFSSFKKNIDSLLAATAGFFIIFLFTRHGGIGIEPDGVVYLTTAENLGANGKLADFTHNALVDFPAFYPFFLSAVMWLTGLKPLLFAPVLNGLLFAIVIYLSGLIMEQFLYRSKWYKIALLTCIVVSPCLLEVYSMLWSETLFLPLLLLFLISLHRYFQSYSRQALIAAAVIVSFASVTRYAGVTIIATGGILLLLDMKLSWRRKLTDAVIYSVISSLLLIINLARNYAVSGTATGAREKSITSLGVNIHDAGSVFYDWLFFLRGHYTGAGVMAIFLMAGLAWLCGKRFLRNRRLTGIEDMAAAFSLLYLLFMVVIASLSRFETLDSRFLSPVFIPLLWICSNWVVSSSHNTAKKKWLLVAGVIIFTGFQYNQLAADYETWDGIKDAGIPGYTEDQWKYSETVQFIQKDSLPFQKDYTIYSNANDAVYFFTGRQGKFLPHKELKKAVLEFLKDPHCYVVWFDDGDNPDLVGLDFITQTKKMKLLKQFSDGAIYGTDE